MSEQATKSIRRLLGIEGGYSNHAADPGGETKFGITRAVARENGYDGEMYALPFSFAEQVYIQKYWSPLKLDIVSEVSDELAYELFEFGVNSGPGRSAKILQVLLNVFNKNEDYYPDLSEDGVIGSVTTGALRSFVGVRGEEGLDTMIKAFNCLQGAYYIKLAQSNKKFEAFVYGWIVHRIKHNYNN